MVSSKRKVLAVVLAVMMVLEMCPLDALAFTLTGTYTGKDYYRVNFQDKEGNLIASQELVLSGGTVTTLPQAPSRQNYTFDNWYIKDTDTVFTTSTVITSDTNVVGKFLPITNYKVTVNYLADTNSEELTNSVVRNYIKSDEVDTIYSPEEIVRTSGTVEGVWYPKQVAVTVDPASLTEDTVYNVYYTKDAASYTIHHMGQSVSDPSVYAEIDSTVKKGAVGATVSAVTKEISGFTFERMSNSIVLKKAEDGSNDLYVYYSRNMYALRYNTNGGSYVPPKEVYFGDSVTVAPDTVPVKEGYKLASPAWYLDAACTQPAPETIVLDDSDMTVYAKWNNGEANYTVQYVKERQGENGKYDYVDSEIISAEVGSTVTGSAGSGVSFSDQKYYVYNEAKSNESSAVVTADGTAVVTYYYDLKTYHIHFEPCSIRLRHLQ